MSDYIKHDFKSGDTLYASQLNEIEDELVSKQAKLVSGTNIKTIGNSSILGSGNLSVYAENGLSLVNNEVVFDSTYGTVGADVEQMREDLNTVKEDLDNLEDSVDDIADDVSALQTKESATERSLEMLWKLNKGQTYDIESQTETGTNDAPSGAEYETLEEVYGKSSQQTTNGYNLFDDTQDNYSLRDFSASLGETLKIQVYTTDGDKKLSFRIVYEDGTRSEIGMIVASADNNVWYSASKELTKNVVSCRFFTSGDGTDRVISKVMLEKGTTAHSYEPYTGGIPQPNPSYPSEIVDVTEENFRIVDDGYVGYSADTFDICKVALKKGKTYVMKNYVNGYNVNAYIVNDADVISKLSAQNSGALYDYCRNLGLTSKAESGTTVTESTRLLDMWYNSATYTIGVDGLYLYFAINSNTLSDTRSYCWEGAIGSTEYAQTSQTRTMSYTLRGIGDYTDVMDVESGKIVRKIAEYVPTSSNRVLTTTTEIDGFTRYYFGTVFDTSGLSMSNSMFTHFSATANQMNKKYCGYTRVKNDNNVRFDVCAPTSLGESGIKAMFDGTFKVKYSLATPTEESINADDLAFLRGLENLSADHTITVTDQNGNDISYLVEYIIKLSEVVS